MPASLLSNQPQLIQVADLPQLGAASDFLAQFQPRPLSLQIVTPGNLGAMTWQWQLQGDATYSAPVASEAQGGAAWSYTLPDPGYGAITFPDLYYLAGSLYTVSSTGTVTAIGGATIGPTAARFDVRQLACAEVTSVAITWMQPRVVPPVLSIGPQILGWLGDLVIYRLRSRQGMTPEQGGAGDDNVRVRAKMAEDNLKLIGASEDRPPDIVDSSTGSGAGFPVMPLGATLRGW